MGNDTNVCKQASVTIELLEGFLGEIRATRMALDTAETFCNKTLAELRSIVAQKATAPVANQTVSSPPTSPVMFEDAELRALKLPERALEALAKHKVTKLSELVRCRKDDVAELSGMTTASRKAIDTLLVQKGASLREGRSYIEITRLREACKEIASPAALKEYGLIIGYRQLPGNEDKWEFQDTPKFYFQAYDAMVTFLTRIGVSDPSKELRLKLGVTDLPTF